jgi:sugar/nucleoside kinase (ribokinase family)
MSSTAQPEVVVVGNVGIDTNVYLHGDTIDFAVEANFTENLDYVGQAGGYAARGYTALGRRVAFVGHVGDDMGGRLVRETFARDGIDARALWRDPAGTARSVNIMARDGARKNFYDGKGHMGMAPDLGLCRSVMAGARLAHLNIPNWARRLLPLARELGLAVACDLQDVVDLDDPYRADFIAAADILFCSAVNHEPAALAAALLAGRPGRLVVVGMGARGAGIADAEGFRAFPPPPLELPVVDTNGAGDALAVGFLTSYVLEGRPAEESLRRGQIAARHTCSLRASSDGLIGAAALDAYAAYIEKGRGDARPGP